MIELTHEDRQALVWANKFVQVKDERNPYAGVYVFQVTDLENVNYYHNCFLGVTPYTLMWSGPPITTVLQWAHLKPRDAAELQGYLSRRVNKKSDEYTDGTAKVGIESSNNWEALAEAPQTAIGRLKMAALTDPPWSTVRVPAKLSAGLTTPLFTANDLVVFQRRYLVPFQGQALRGWSPVLPWHYADEKTERAALIMPINPARATPTEGTHANDTEDATN